jgi:hypothetical protein
MDVLTFDMYGCVSTTVQTSTGEGGVYIMSPNCFLAAAAAVYTDYTE